MTSEEEWKKKLTPEQFEVLRQAGTEKPYDNKYNDEKSSGTSVCAGCGQELFSSEDKYDSGSGWPSFTKPMEDGVITEQEDKKLFMKRTEVLCSKCQGHLGHVFDDGPQEEGGKRYCLNSVALNLENKKKNL